MVFIVIYAAASASTLQFKYGDGRNKIKLVYAALKEKCTSDVVYVARRKIDSTREIDISSPTSLKNNSDVVVRNIASSLGSLRLQSSSLPDYEEASLNSELTNKNARPFCVHVIDVF
ncbi:hypothetical protein C8F04DRAFT_1194578 [Mycena alexandri]|uniref:Uncharacterized protein n=1 Tax=Mycena alexandri TaxID=1745969 RepID=A0AAD6S7M7_9AGAR|nr:hypothetical protein C8F04DRAFT_1194578 [Mycena alexandri]